MLGPPQYRNCGITRWPLRNVHIPLGERCCSRGSCAGGPRGPNLSSRPIRPPAPSSPVILNPQYGAGGAVQYRRGPGHRRGSSRGWLSTCGKSAPRRSQKRPRVAETLGSFKPRYEIWGGELKPRSPRVRQSPSLGAGRRSGRRAGRPHISLCIRGVGRLGPASGQSAPSAPRLRGVEKRSRPLLTY
jgi:hypothetical protein